MTVVMGIGPCRAVPPSQAPLGRRDRVRRPRIGLERLAQGARDRLERGLGDVVAVEPRQRLDMEGDTAMRGERLKEFAYQLAVEGADLVGGQIHAPREIGPPRQVERRTHQRVVHRQQARPVAADSALVAERLRERLPECDAYVLDRVVVVDVAVAVAAHGQVQQRVARELVEHVVEEADAAAVVVAPCPVERDLDADIGFRGLSGDARAAHVASCPAPRDSLLQTACRWKGADQPDTPIPSRRRVQNVTSRSAAIVAWSRAATTSPLSVEAAGAVVSTVRLPRSAPSLSRSRRTVSRTRVVTLVPSGASSAWKSVRSETSVKSDVPPSGRRPT